MYEMIGKLVCRHTTLLNDEFFKRPQDKEDVHWRLFRAIKNKDIRVVQKLQFLNNNRLKTAKTVDFVKKFAVFGRLASQPQVGR
jgi:hypothetical protein